MDTDSRRPDSQSLGKTIRQGSVTEPLDGKTRRLLALGEDFLRAGRYQQAIHIWTKILFLDRGNLEARKLIERAKRAIAERQRQLDLMVVEAARRLEQGERQRARRELARVLALDPRHTEGRILMENLEALERRVEVRSGSLSMNANRDSPRANPGKRDTQKLRRRSKARANGVRKPKSGSSLKMAAFLFCAFCSFAAGGLYLHLNWDFLISDRGLSSSRQAGSAALGDRARLPLPLPSELYYYNGARLYANRRYREALSELSRVERRSGFFEEARNLTLRIEQRLLRGAIPVESAESVPAASNGVN